MPFDFGKELHAELLITACNRRIRRQRELIAKLTRLGSDTTLAEQLLANLEAAQQTRLAKRDGLLSQWGWNRSPEGGELGGRAS